MHESQSTTPQTPATAPAASAPAVAKEPTDMKKDESKPPVIIKGSKADKAAKAAAKMASAPKIPKAKKPAAKKPAPKKKPAVKKAKKAKPAGAGKTPRASATYPACSKKNPYREGSMKSKAFGVFAKGGTRVAIIAGIVKLGATEATASTWVQRFRSYAAPGGEK